MKKDVLINFVISIFFAIVIIAILFWTHLITDILHYMRKFRGTSEYEGESNGLENLNITVGIVFPVLLLLTFVIVTFCRRKPGKKNTD